MENFKRYCQTYFKSLCHPFCPSITIGLDHADLAEAIDFACQIVGAPVNEPRLSNFDMAFEAAFNQYLVISRDQGGALHNAVERLAGLLEPFLKKLTYLSYPNRTYRKGKKARPLWHFGMEDILNASGMAAPGLDKTDPKYWEKQPVEQAMWRIALISRHKGAHETHRYDLVELERIATAVICCYLLSARFALKDTTSRATSLIRSGEARRLEELLSVRAGTHRVTGDLPGELEHLRLYTVKEEISVGEEEARLLFESYLAGNGPVHYFLQSTPPTLQLYWARELMEHAELRVRQNAAELLISAGNTIPLKQIVSLYDTYSFRFRLASHIKRHAKPEDLALLWKLHRHRSETVREAVMDSFLKLATDSHDSFFQQAAVSSSAATKELFFRWALKLADPSKLSVYRQQLSGRAGGSNRSAIISLAKIGRNQELKLLESILRSRRTNRTTRETAAMAVSLLAARLRDKKTVKSLLQDGRNYIARAAIKGLSYGESGYWVNDLIRLYKKHPTECSQTIMRCAKVRHGSAIRTLLQKVDLDNSAKKLCLCLLRIGNPSTLSFLMNLFANYRQFISFWEQYELIFPMSESAAKSVASRRLLRKFIEPTEFWEYYGATRPKNKMPVFHHENLPLIKRIVGLSFGEVALRRDRPLLFKMLEHSYWSVYHGAANALSRIGTDRDLVKIVELALRKGRERWERRGLMDAITALDSKFYSRIARDRRNQLAFGDAD